MPNFDLENLYSKKYKIIAGIDEAGRGALAGPVFAAAVIFNNNINYSIKIKDSKKLSSKQRLRSYYEIINSCKVSVAYVDNLQIDKINILNATFEAMKKAIDTLVPQPEFLLIDGNRYRTTDKPFKTIVKGDSKSLSIAAASIVAKVSRDNFMIEVADRLYPNYGFAKHKGYATLEHIQNILKFGITPIHRIRFLKNILKEPQLFVSNY